MSGLSSSPNTETTLADALQDSLQAEAPHTTTTAQPSAAHIATAVSRGIDDSSLGLSPSPVLQSPFAARAAAADNGSGDLSSAEADSTIAANLRRTLNRLNTLSLPVALVTAKSDALPDSPEAPTQVLLLIASSHLSCLIFQVAMHVWLVLHEPRPTILPDVFHIGIGTKHFVSIMPGVSLLLHQENREINKLPVPPDCRRICMQVRMPCVAVLLIVSFFLSVLKLRK